MVITYSALGCQGLEITVPFELIREEKGSKGEWQVPNNVKFGEDGYLRLDPEKKKDAFEIKVLEASIHNEKNGGDLFRKQEDEINGLVEANNGKTFAAMPKGGLSESDIENFQYLSKIKPGMPPPTRKKVVGILENIYERFTITGIAKVNLETRPLIINAQVLVLMETIEERGIWSNGNTEGEGSSGQGTPED